MRGDLAAARAWATIGLLLAGGCDRAPERQAVAPAVPATALPADTIIVADRWATAEGLRDGDVLRVQRLVIRRAGQPDAMQVIDELSTETPWPPDAPGLQAVDMNFDGHPDLRLIEFRAAGPNTPWRHWLYDPAEERFLASAALDALSPTRFDAARRLVIADWRDGAARSGSVAYAWQDGALQPATMPP